MWAATEEQSRPGFLPPVSIRAARVGGDRQLAATNSNKICFNPRRPCGRRPVHAPAFDGKHLFQSAPPVWAATVYDTGRTGSKGVSIRAARVGGDHAGNPVVIFSRGFNPRRPCGRRHRSHKLSQQLKLFQSAPPVWAATIAVGVGASRVSFNPRRPCGRRLVLVGSSIRQSQFQSAPPVWAATLKAETSTLERLFQSAPPVWAATGKFPLRFLRPYVSIRAARVGGDVKLAALASAT